MTFLDIATKPALNAERRRGLLLPQTREIWLTGHLLNIRYCLVEVIFYALNISFKGRKKGAGIETGNILLSKYLMSQKHFVVKLSHESKLKGAPRLLFGNGCV